MSSVLLLVAKAGPVRAASVERINTQMTIAEALRISFIEGPTELAPVSELAPRPKGNSVGP